jgi:agmatinase
MSRAREFAPVVQVGIRSRDVEEKERIDAKKIFYAERIRFDKVWADKVIGVMQQKVYITIDLDVFDPSYVPSTGTPEPGGLSWYDVIDLVRLIDEKLEIVGFDVVELCPNRFEKASDFLASKLIYKILSYKFNK